MFKLKRLFTSIIIRFSIFILPWWVPVLLSVIASWYCFYYEIILIGFILDLLYRSDVFIHFPMFFTIVLTIGMLLLRFLKKQLRFYV